MSNPEIIKLAVIGSSNSAGMGSSTYIRDPCADDEWRSPGSSWLGRLSRCTNRMSILNFSKSGAHSDWALERAESIFIGHRPHYALMCTNPIADGDDGSRYLRNAARFAIMAKQYGITPIFRGAYSYNGYDCRQYEYMLKMNKNLSEAFDKVIDHMSCLSDKCGHYISGNMYHVDGLHPNDEGHLVLFNAARLSPALARLL